MPIQFQPLMTKCKRPLILLHLNKTTILIFNNFRKQLYAMLTYSLHHFYDLSMKNLKAVSLFSSGGIADLALRECGIQTIVANEIIEGRAKVFEYNYPYTKMVIGDIWLHKKKIIQSASEILRGTQLDFLFATPPCQGMSKNGRGKLLDGIRKGIKPKFDQRNQLIIPTLEIAKKLRPTTIIFENVTEMENTFIEDENGCLVNIINYIKNSLEGYVGNAETVEFANYGVPQKRQRLITIFTRNKSLINYFNEHNSFLPPQTHSQYFNRSKKPWVTVRDAISSIPPIDALSKESASYEKIPYHNVPILDKDKYLWVSNTPENKSAFDNQCINPSCLFNKNQTHGASKGKDGINRSHKTTPIRCEKCHKLLPRPWVKKDGEYRLMKGYTSAYKRMSWDAPASSLTRNLSYACSDNKLHPSQNRVLSLHEAFIIHTIDKFNYEWKRRDNKNVSNKCIRDIIGESIPPKGLAIIFDHLTNLKKEGYHFMDVLEQKETASNEYLSS